MTSLVVVKDDPKEYQVVIAALCRLNADQLQHLYSSPNNYWDAHDPDENESYSAGEAVEKELVDLKKSLKELHEAKRVGKREEEEGILDAIVRSRRFSPRDLPFLIQLLFTRLIRLKRSSHIVSAAQFIIS